MSELIPTELCLEKIMYDVLNTSAWAKLYERTLFDTVFDPVGMLFEDIGTTYKLLMQCERIAIGYETKYNYILRSNSILTAAFSPKKLDLLIMTDQMARNVIKRYLELEYAALRRRVYARFSTLNQMLDTENAKKEREKIISFIKKNSLHILRDKKAPKRDQVAIILLLFSYKPYKRVWKLRQNRLFA